MKKERQLINIAKKNMEEVCSFTDCCGNWMYSVDNNPMEYHGCLCPKCFLDNKFVTLYLRGTPEGIRVFESEKTNGRE